MTAKKPAVNDEALEEPPPRAVAADDGEPGLSWEEYLERRRELEGRLLALAARLVASRRFPRVMYHATQLPRIVGSVAERQALGAGWQPTPVEGIVMALTPLPRMTEPPMSDADYQASLMALDAARAALEVAYITSQTYPRWGYHETEPPQLVHSDAEALALGEGWSAVPIDAPVEASVITSLDPDTVMLGAPSFTVRVLGTGFVADSVIVWNGSDEVTAFVSATELTTGVNMDTATAAVSVSVAVRNGEALSNEWFFTFTEATP